MEDDQRMVAAKRPHASDHLIEDDPERPDVAAPIHWLAPHLLRRHVGRRPHERSGAGGRVLPTHLGDAEVEDLHLAASGDHDVAGLDVAVHDARFVGALQAAGHLPRDLDRFPPGDRAPGDSIAERLSIVARHDDEGGAVRRPVDGVDSANGGMIEGRRGARLPGEALQRLLVPAGVRRQELERDVAIEVAIAGPIHDPHTTAPQGAEDSIRPDDRSHQSVGIHRIGWLRSPAFRPSSNQSIEQAEDRATSGLRIQQRLDPIAQRPVAGAQLVQPLAPSVSLEVGHRLEDRPHPGRRALSRHERPPTRRGRSAGRAPP